MHASTHAVYVRGVPSVYPDAKPRQGGPCTKHSSSRRSRPITPAEAKASPRPRTCMHVRTPWSSASGHLRACMSEAEGRPRSRQA
eukprot:365152-Chlamydomonas_euryale.AAC.6